MYTSHRIVGLLGKKLWEFFSQGDVIPPDYLSRSLQFKANSFTYFNQKHEKRSLKIIGSFNATHSVATSIDSLVESRCWQLVALLCATSPPLGGTNEQSGVTDY